MILKNWNLQGSHNMKKKKILLLLVIMCFLLTGCSKNLKDKDNKIVKNEVTGQNLVANILCQPTAKSTIEKYLLSH